MEAAENGTRLTERLRRTGKCLRRDEERSSGLSPPPAPATFLHTKRLAVP